VSLKTRPGHQQRLDRSPPISNIPRDQIRSQVILQTKFRKHQQKQHRNPTPNPANQAVRTIKSLCLLIFK